MRTQQFYQQKDIETFKQNLLLWSQQFTDVVWLDSNNHKDKYSCYDAVLAVEAFTALKTDFSEGFERLKDYQSTTKDWIFGYLTYDLKNNTEPLKSQNFDGLNFPDLYFFQPQKLFLIQGHQVEIQYLNLVEDEIEQDLRAISEAGALKHLTSSHEVKIKLRTSKEAYFNKLETMLEHIHRGDIYEANFCQEFYAEHTEINPLETFNKLNSISKPPFATFFKAYKHYALSASPERYIQKRGHTVISQPIKGTAKRALDLEEDERLKLNLAKDLKERSENIMIVDLVRNDLSHTALKGSVEVKELCKVHSFLQVHQMISTIASKVSSETHPVDIISSTFPMGSMTGVPKISAMRIMEALEDAKRGLYSGAIGYFTPEGDFDFNVVIRSILYNAEQNYVSFSVGGAITAKSDPLKEYEECLTKAKAMREALENQF